ncbi:MAG: SAM-dependent methyltransferase [Quisquiliibacterium sp.]
MRVTDLPTPEADARQASQALAHRIRERIQSADGWIGFDEYMKMALYEPALGYYSGGARKFGRAGDFVTAPQISPLFGQCLADQCLQWFEHLPARVIEFGAGGGELAVQLLSELVHQGRGDCEYLIVELSGELRERQRQAIAALGPDFEARVRWLEQWPERIEGVVIGNELVDAMPVQLFRVDGARLLERGVRLEGESFAFDDRDAGSALAAQIEPTLLDAWGPRENWPEQYLSEFGAQAKAWISELAGRLVRGAVLLLDYGFPRHEYLHPQRATGTLMCHYRHFAHTDPFVWPGLQDITAHVNFSTLAAAAAGGGLDCLGYCSQARLLMNLGLLDRLGAIAPENLAGYLPNAQAAKRLLSESEMGELFKAIAFGRGLDDQANGFARGDRRGSL